MATRTVRLDEKTEARLARLRKTTGLSISELLKRGLESYDRSSPRKGSPRAYDIYKRFDLGEGGWSLGPASEAKRVVREVIRRKHNR